MKKYFFSLCLILGISKSFSQVSFILTDTLCEGASANVSANVGTLTVSGYNWSSTPSGPNIVSPSSAASNIVFPTAGTYTIDLAVTSGTNIYMASNAITVLPNPTITVSGPTGFICPPPTFIGGLSMTASGANNYTWTPGGLTGANYSSMQPSSSTNFNVFGTDVYGCSSNASFFVSVYPLPSLFAGSNSPVCVGNNICLNASGSLVIYYWQGPCGYSSFNPNDCFTSSLGCGGTYTIGGTDVDGCVNEAFINVVVSTCTGLEENGSDPKDLLVYPNPANDKLSIRSTNAENKNTQIEITDALGRLVLARSENFESSNEVHTIDISNLNKGIYFLKLSSENKTIKMEKLVKD